MAVWRPGRKAGVAKLTLMTAAAIRRGGWLSILKRHRRRLAAQYRPRRQLQPARRLAGLLGVKMWRPKMAAISGGVASRRNGQMANGGVFSSMSKAALYPMKAIISG